MRQKKHYYNSQSLLLFINFDKNNYLPRKSEVTLTRLFK